MPHTLAHDAYGKSNVRLTKVTRNPDGRHDLLEVSVDIELQGEFQRSYTHGENAQVIPTDTMKNTVYALAKQHTFDSIEQFGQLLASHFVANNKQVTRATVALSQSPFQRIRVDDQPHPHAFVGGGSERRTAAITVTRDGTRISSGVDGLLLLKTTASAFKGFVRDPYTTLQETGDRIFATILQMNWTCNAAAAAAATTTCLDYNALHATVRQTALRVFAQNFSHAVQQTLFQIGDEVLNVCPAIDQVDITMPNKHRILANLQPLGLSNDNEIFITTDEPYGLIKGTIKRGE